MTKQQPSYKVIDGLKGSEQHHPLKNRPGEKGDPNHTDPDHGAKASKDDQDNTDNSGGA
ncbi:hypothetical protein [Phaeobacter italicus]|jgi:hypothetical protein|uniref:hypothetical protein n=1 Tax=Phaeobacter italicus TaxID=481446 RepID=UPI000669E155|nr:hypothetical protein [Phaeobacter italicus]MBY6043325.1 hypothetical protein [Phaeobacter italicus]NKX71153.1 hypothetical protein [Rhodobacteraceae bacterium R_SAG1]CRL13652.1 hypothetical protein NIT7645_00666 [Phaeobacter italicus]SFH61174.1 hypothetical protein SAMN04488019_12135 [Phaeobacter italicus]